MKSYGRSGSKLIAPYDEAVYDIIKVTTVKEKMKVPEVHDVTGKTNTDHNKEQPP
jgi:hypothetical protein